MVLMRMKVLMMRMMRGRKPLKGKSGSRTLIPLGAILGGLWV